MAKIHVAAQPPPSVDETALERFERELHARYPERITRRYAMPSAVKQCLAVYLVEVTTRDEIQASIYADATMTQLEKRSAQLVSEAQRRETMRASIVGLVTRDQTPVYRHVNNGGAPFHEFDEWPAKVSAALLTYFNELNGLNTDELIEGLKGARTIGTSPPPSESEIPKKAPIEK